MNILQIFKHLSPTQIISIAEELNTASFTKDGVEEIVHKIVPTLSDQIISEIINSYFYFFLKKEDHEDIVASIKNSELDLKKKDALTKSLEIIYLKSDPKILSLIADTNYLNNFGHMHLHKLGIATDFRPLSDNGKIIKFIPALVFSGNTHYGNLSDEEQTINFQLSLKTAEKIVKDIQNSIDAMKVEIKDIRKKFGDEIID